MPLCDATETVIHYVHEDEETVSYDVLIEWQRCLRRSIRTPLEVRRLQGAMILIVWFCRSL